MYSWCLVLQLFAYFAYKKNTSPKKKIDNIYINTLVSYKYHTYMKNWYLRKLEILESRPEFKECLPVTKDL
jgi:hypothetical protein